MGTLGARGTREPQDTGESSTRGDRRGPRAPRQPQVDAKLQDVCLRLARQLYPDCPIEPPAMIMRDVYEHLTYIYQPYDHFVSPISAWYADVVPNPSDAVFSVGTVQKLVADESSPEAST